MCQSVYDVKTKNHITTAAQFAAYLGVSPEELITWDGEPMPENTLEYNWHIGCLCPFAVSDNLDASNIWHRRSPHFDPMTTLAMRD